MTLVSTGLEQLAASPPASLNDQRIGLLCNSASVNREFVHARQLMHRLFGSRLRALFSPQHGLFAEKQDNMIESKDGRDTELAIPIFSLYSHTRKPTRFMFEHIDTLLIDLQDVGTRVYTFIYTMSYCLEAASRYKKKVIVLDRPNPIGGDRVEGNILNPAWRSFVGRYPLPMRHGMTIGELALMFNKEFGIHCDLEIIPMSGWKREMLFPETDLPWIAPSPNLPTPTSALVYPGQVIWEGTNVSEGRGTTQPFEIFGAPYIDPDRVRGGLDESHLEGCVLRTLAFEPTSNKWQAEVCRGFQIHVTDARRYRPYRASLAMLQAIIGCHPDRFDWKAPPYEYEYERLPMDLIIGDQKIRKQVTESMDISVLEASWRNPLQTYDRMRRKYFLY